MAPFGEKVAPERMAPSGKKLALLTPQIGTPKLTKDVSKNQESQNPSSELLSSMPSRRGSCVVHLATHVVDPSAGVADSRISRRIFILRKSA